MNWLKLSEKEILEIANPIMDNLMQASTEINHEKHVRDFSKEMKEIVTKDNFEEQCKDYQENLGYFSKREFVGIYRKENDVRVFWRQFYTKSDNEFVAFVHLVKRNEKIEVVNAIVN